MDSKKEAIKTTFVKQYLRNKRKSNCKILVKEHERNSKHTKETKKKISNSLIGKPSRFKNHKHSSSSNFKHSSTLKELWSQSKFTGMLNKKQSLETKKKISTSTKGKNNPFYGEHHSEDTKQIIRQKRLLQVIPVKDTSIERKVQEELSLRELIYYKHFSIFGQPDLAFPDKKVAIFCDGDYSHLNPEIYDINNCSFSIKASDKWARDKLVTDTLRNQGWLVLRYWEHEINNNVESVVDEIEEIILTQRGDF